VKGWLHNNGSSTVTHSTADITCSISGTAAFTGPNFSINMAPGAALNFIDHVFTITHNPGGDKTVNFTVQYGVTGITNFGSNKSVSVSLALDTLYKGCWIRSGGVWKQAVPYVRTGGIWKQAVPYIRTGGVWKGTN
jgi:hypothetical protein